LRFKKAFVIATIASCAVGTVALSNNWIPVFAVSQEDIDDAKNNEEKLAERLDEAQKMLEELSSKADDLRGYIEELDTQIAKIEANITAINGQMEAKQKEIDSNELALEQANKDKEEQYEAMKQRIQYMYETGQTTYLEVFLASDNISELLNQTEYVKSITEYDKKMMDKLIETIKTIEGIETTLKTEYSELESLKGDFEAEEAAVALLQNEKEKELEEVVANAENQEKLAAQIESERQAAEDKIQELLAQKQREDEEARRREEASKSSSAPSVVGTGDFIWPLPSSNTIITELYGPRIHPILGTASFHYAIDVSANRGTPVYAADSGTVLIAEYNYSYGNFVLISHGNGYATVYAHAERLLVTPGQKVNKGDVIMNVGSTGYSTGPHLHYEIRLNGERINPLDYYDTSVFSYHIT